MSTKIFGKKAILAIVLIGISAGYASADKAELQAKLSKEVKIQLSDVTIAEALEKIGQKAGVKFVLSDEAVWKLPQGEATRLSVALGGPLAESMTEMLNAFFMRYAVGDEEITIYPRPELEHILGRPTAKQLELLTEIYTLTITVSGQIDSKTIINKMLGQDVLVLPVNGYSQLNKYMGELGRGLPEGEHSPPFTLAQILDSTNFKWYLSGMDFPRQIPEVRLVSSSQFRKAKLDQIVDISFKDERAEVIIQRLANWTGMELLVYKEETSWLEEKISVNMQNIKLRQALLNIANTVDGVISFDIGDNEILIKGPIHKKIPVVPRKTQSKVSGEGYVGKISIPMDGGKYYIEFMLREKDLTEELRQLRQEKMNEILGQEESDQDVEEESGD
ncbi:MAG: hypothetical protein ACYS8Y_09490 [Planctomycetota bacterium]|jgi:hypothetical protein